MLRRASLASLNVSQDGDDDMRSDDAGVVCVVGHFCLILLPT